MQRRQILVAESGNASARASDWLSMIADYATGAALKILEDSEVDNDLLSPHDSFYEGAAEGSIPQAERMTSMYGSISTFALQAEKGKSTGVQSSKRASLGPIPTFSSNSQSWPTPVSVDSDEKSYPLLTQEEMVSAVLVCDIVKLTTTRTWLVILLFYALHRME